MLEESSSVTRTPSATETLITVFAALVSSSTAVIDFYIALSNMKAHEDRYKHPDLALKLFTIPPESIIIMHDKIFIKTRDLAYFKKVW